ncbi:(4Fe-4S)-binding protein [Kitasatospora sp. NPDC101235]|uniref:(4Fe-4S)-binding protein n=1 Tax=Kitasatospora sp. NPDC101235 TaxID=3364101 RepID=UPI0037F776D5
MAVTLDADVCRHTAECVHGLPTVFVTERRPWISPDASAPEADADGEVRETPRAMLCGCGLSGGSRTATGLVPAGPADPEPPTRTNDNRQISTFR